MNGWSAICPAKVNLALRILAREDSGYHRIETVFQAVGLCDRVDAFPADAGISLEVRRDGPGTDGHDIIGELGDPDANTTVRAARAFYAETGLRPAVSLVLTKAIPAGTGLGGGSSDAAGTLAALNAMHGEPLSAAEIIVAGGRIGADVPFFCGGAATALAWGRGDRLLGCPSPRPAPVVIALPRVRVSTAAAYAEASLKLKLPADASITGSAVPGTWAGLAELQSNDFEGPVFARHPLLAEIRDALAGEGAAIARMTGSGSAVFGVFAERAAAAAAAERVRTMDGVAAARLVSTLSALPPVEPIDTRGVSGPSP